MKKDQDSPQHRRFCTSVRGAKDEQPSSEPRLASVASAWRLQPPFWPCSPLCLIKGCCELWALGVSVKMRENKTKQTKTMNSCQRGQSQVQAKVLRETLQG